MNWRGNTTKPTTRKSEKSRLHRSKPPGAATYLPNYRRLISARSSQKAGRIELTDATGKSQRIETSENSVQSWHRSLVFCHHLITLCARHVRWICRSAIGIQPAMLPSRLDGGFPKTMNLDGRRSSWLRKLTANERRGASRSLTIGAVFIHSRKARKQFITAT